MDFSTLSDSEIYDMISRQCGITLLDDEGNASVEVPTSNAIPTYWTVFSSASTSEERFLLTKAEVLKELIGIYRRDINVRIGPDAFTLRQRFENLLDIQEDVQEDLDKITGLIGPGKLTVHQGATYMPLSPSPRDERLKNSGSGRRRKC